MKFRKYICPGYCIETLLQHRCKANSYPIDTQRCGLNEKSAECGLAIPWYVWKFRLLTSSGMPGENTHYYHRLYTGHNEIMIH